MEIEKQTNEYAPIEQMQTESEHQTPTKAELESVQQRLTETAT